MARPVSTSPLCPVPRQLTLGRRDVLVLVPGEYDFDRDDESRGSRLGLLLGLVWPSFTPGTQCCGEC